MAKKAKKKKAAKQTTPNIFEKIRRITAKVQSLPATGTSPDGQYSYTQADTIVPIFAALFDRFNVQPYYEYGEPKCITLGGVAGVEISCSLYLKDLDRPQNKSIYMGRVYGQGFNFGWSCDSAQTVALKLALIKLMNAACKAKEGTTLSDDKSQDVYATPEERKAFAEAANQVSGIIKDNTPDRTDPVPAEEDEDLNVFLPERKEDRFWSETYLAKVKTIIKHALRPNTELNMLSKYTREMFGKDYPTLENEYKDALMSLYGC